LAFSYFAGLEDASVVKIIGVLVCFGGAVSVGLQDEESRLGSLGGDVMALFGSIGYGLYTTAMRAKAPEESNINMQLLLGYIGIINAVILLPILLMMFFLSLGHVDEITGKVVGFISLNGFADTVLADYFWARAVVLTSPTVATIGMSITIPIAILSDFLLKGNRATWVSILGALFVVSGFVLVNLTPETLSEYYQKTKRALDCCSFFSSSASSSSLSSSSYTPVSDTAPAPATTRQQFSRNPMMNDEKTIRFDKIIREEEEEETN
jgi:drug/metabolite transporter (DMT)-like permease